MFHLIGQQLCTPHNSTDMEVIHELALVHALAHVQKENQPQKQSQFKPFKDVGSHQLEEHGGVVLSENRGFDLCKLPRYEQGKQCNIS